ncbi:MAG: hypothetical protein J6W54_16220 [Fibrobacter sp.]|uniref:YDG domain-containing protein n=1 Tax=Fibrobacter sp. TaxID=35828 RepID=UPI001B06B2FF|nr:YDG domain-containing protein [Fibrobacter sp.]MBO7062611.1 hypothetical protein [Fibrobacter sp.]MBO7104079.1 hypothetical protein [Fibrobacter sp.]
MSKIFSLLIALPFAVHAACDLVLNEAGELLVGTFEDLAKVGVEDCALDAKYRLTADIVAPANEDEWHGFEPISGFSGEFHGAGHKIRNLKLFNDNFEGLFGRNMDGLVDSLGLEDIYVNGGYYTGAVVGYDGSGTIRNVHVTGKVMYMGSNSEESYIGGIAGVFSGTIENCYFVGNIGENYHIGGIVGMNQGTVKTSYAINEGTLSGMHKSEYNVGSVVGVNENTGTVENSYGMTFADCSGHKVVGLNLGSVDDNSASVECFDYNYNGGMKTKDFFVGFDFENTWEIAEGKTSPFLKANLNVVTGVKPVMYAKEYCTGKVVGIGMALMPEGLDERNYDGKFDVVEVGDKMVVDFSEVYALNQNGYAFVSDTLDIPISPLTLTVTGVAVEDKAYDGTADAEISGVPKIEGVCKDDSVTLDGSLTAKFENAEVGKNKKIVLSGLTLDGDSAVLVNYKLELPELKAEIYEKTESIEVHAVVQNKALDRDAKIHFNGYSLIAEKNGQRFDLLGNKLK